MQQKDNIKSNKNNKSQMSQQQQLKELNDRITRSIKNKKEWEEWLQYCKEFHIVGNRSRLTPEFSMVLFFVATIIFGILAIVKDVAPFGVLAVATTTLFGLSCITKATQLCVAKYQIKHYDDKITKLQNQLDNHNTQITQTQNQTLDTNQNQFANNLNQIPHQNHNKTNQFLNNQGIQLQQIQPNIYPQQKTTQQNPKTTPSPKQQKNIESDDLTKARHYIKK